MVNSCLLILLFIVYKLALVSETTCTGTVEIETRLRVFFQILVNTSWASTASSDPEAYLLFHRVHEFCITAPALKSNVFSILFEFLDVFAQFLTGEL